MLKPLPNSQWDYTKAAHLLNRAGFGGSPREITQLFEMGLEKAVSFLVDYEQISHTAVAPEWAKPDPDRQANLLKLREKTEQERRQMLQERLREGRQRILELQYWWLTLMVESPRPLQEKMTLFWHGHFATSAQKVREPYFMWLQNETFRQNALGSWYEMLLAMSKDPAMLIWLDNAISRKNKPNENYAREIMELFSLGEGHYSEKDIQEAARAFTGWTLNRLEQKFTFNKRQHDDGEKVFLGLRGRLNGEDIVAQIVKQPQAARFITAKLWRFFAQENPSEPFIEGLAQVFRDHNNHFKPLLKTIFLCEEFYAPTVIRTQVKSPIYWLVNSIKILEKNLPPALICLNVQRLLGQELFLPPNVKGWDGGLTWITTNNLLNRYNLSSTLVQGNNNKSVATAPAANQGEVKPALERLTQAQLRRVEPADPQKLFTEQERQSPDNLIIAMEKRFTQAPLKAERKKTLIDYLAKQPRLTDNVIRHAMRLYMSTPDFQLT